VVQVLRTWYKKSYGWAADIVLSKYCKLFTDMTILAASGYLMAKKLFGLSISNWLLANAFHQPLVNLYFYSSAIALSTAIGIKMIALLFEHFPPTKQAAVPPDEISDCLLVINKEILSHLKRLDPLVQADIKDLKEQHAFDVNIRIIVEALAEQIRRSIDTITLKRRDIFISVYSFDEVQKCLLYELHYDSKRDIVNSRRMCLDDERYRAYECVKCINQGVATAYVLDKSRYAKGHSKRHKSVKQYMGATLGLNDHLFGFLNIEFHNHFLFTDEDEMQEFMEGVVFPFKLLLEYQFLKKLFFEKFSDFEKYWKAT